MKRNTLGQFQKQEKEEEAITIPIPKTSTLILIILMSVLLIPWIRMIMNLELMNKVDKFFNFEANGSCKLSENMDKTIPNGKGGWGL